MFHVHLLQHEPNHEFEKPICLCHVNENVKFACSQVDLAQKKMQDEFRQLMETFFARHEQMKKSLYLQLEMMVKESGHWPKDWSAARDHLVLREGVVFHARCGQGDKKCGG